MSPTSQTLPESLFGSIHLLKFLPLATAMALSSAAPTFLLEYFCRWTSAGCMLTCSFPLPVCTCHPAVSFHGLHGVPAQGDLLPHQYTHARGPTTAPLASTHAWSHCYPAVMHACGDPHSPAGRHLPVAPVLQHSLTRPPRTAQLQSICQQPLSECCCQWTENTLAPTAQQELDPEEPENKVWAWS